MRIFIAGSIVGLVVNALSPDRPEDGFPVHHRLLSAGKYIINTASLDRLPRQGSWIVALPIKTKGGKEASI